MSWSEVLNIRSSEAGLASRVAGLMFCASSGAAIGSPGFEALFFSRFGVQYLPPMYIALGLAIVATSLGITTLLGRLDRRRLYTFLPLALAAGVVVARVLVASGVREFYPLLWLGMNVYWTLLNLFTWGLAAMACDTRQAKRLFPLFSAAGILGLVAGGLATGTLVAWLGTENLLLVWAASLLLAFALAQAIARVDARPGRGARRKSVPLLEGIRQGYAAARRSPVLRWMALAAVLFAVLYYSVVFPFSKAVAAQFPGEDDLAAFLGVFQGASMGAALLASLLLANRLYARFGIMTSILVYPLLYFVGFLALGTWPAFGVLAAFRFSQLFWSEGVSEGANQAMYNLVPSTEREQARTFVRGIANPAGVSLAGVLLLFGELGLRPGAMALAGMLAAAATAYLVWRARGAYGQALVAALRRGQSHVFSGEEDPFGGLRQDAGAVQAVVAGLSSPEVTVRRVSAEILASLKRPDLVEATLPSLEADEDPAVRAAGLRAAGRAGAASARLAVVSHLNDPDPQVRLEAVAALRQLVQDPSELDEALRPLLQDPDLVVRSRAAVSLLAAGPHPEAGAAIREQATRGELPGRVAALRSLAVWGSQSAYDLAALGLEDSHPAIRAQAADILSKIDAQQCIFPLVERLGDEDPSVRAAAAHALGRVGRPAVKPVWMALSDPAQEDGALLALEELPVQELSQALTDFASKRADQALRYHELWLAAQGGLASENPGEATRLASETLRDRALEAAKKALRATALSRDSGDLRGGIRGGIRGDVRMAIENLDSADPEQRANALETLDVLFQSGPCRGLLALWESTGRQRPVVKDWLERMLADEDPWLRAAAALAVKEVGDPEARRRLAHLAENDPDELVRQAACDPLAPGPPGREGEPGMKTLQTLSLMERILFLRRVPLFGELSPGDLKGVAAIASEQVFAAGESIARGGEVGAEMYVIVSGEVRVVSDREGGQGREIVRRKAGEYVGEMSILNRTPRIASLVAVGEVRLLSIERTEFEEILRLRPEASLAVMRVLCNRLIECDQQVAAGIH